MDQTAVLAGRYEVSGLLGSGGMADVYAGRDLRLERPVAVKVLRPGQAGDTAFRTRFHREALSAASLNHPRIVAVYDTGEDRVDGVEVPFIVLEYVEGRTLSDLVRDGPRPTVSDALRMTADVLDALGHAHEHGIVHRDVKPANVMLSARHGVTVMDFGIARPVGVSGMTVTGTAMVVGTADYLAPEQARGLPVDARSDLYSTGCLLYELLTGRPPFVADSPLAAAWKHVEEQPLPPSAHQPDVPAACDAVVLRALRKDRGERWRDAAEMRGALLAALREPERVPPSAVVRAARPATAPAAAPPGAPVPAPAPRGVRPAGRAARPARRRGRVAWLTAGALLALVAVLAGLHALRVRGTLGPHTTVVAPDLRGSSVSQARRRALAQHLHLAAIRVGSCAPAASPQRVVCAQQPAPGAHVRTGTGISLRVSPRGR